MPSQVKESENLSGQSKPIYEFDHFRVDPSESLLLRDGHPIQLPPKVFDTLIVLIENRGRLVRKDELLAVLWPDTFVEEATLARNISDLRKALGDSAGEHKFIETVPKRGYRFLGSIIMSERQLVLERRLQSRIVVQEDTDTRPALKSIAVLPFKPLGSDGDDEYLGLGMADALITRLSNVRQIIVRPTSAVAKYVDAEQDLFLIGRELEVGSLVDGKFQRSAEGIRVTVQLVGVQRRATLWADKFDGKLTDIFEMEDWISERVTAALTLQLTQQEHEQLVRHRTENTHAYEAYLKGCYFWNKRGTEDLRKGIEYLEQATSADPNYASAYAMLADCYTILAIQDSLPQTEAFGQARKALTRALQIDDQLPEAHGSLAHLKLHDWDWPGAEAEFKLATELNPGLVSAHVWYAEYLTVFGRTDEAIAELRRATLIDPVSLVVRSCTGRALYFGRRYDEAIEEYRRALEMDAHFYAAHLRLGLCYAQKGMGDLAIAELEGTSKFDPNPDSWAALGYALASAGRKAEADEWLNRLRQLPGSARRCWYQMAIVSAALGRKDRAFEFLGEAYKERSGALVNLKVEPMFDGLRSDMRFTEILRRVGLAA
jgi:DNA-binding winged helix-turn-helix (wHTH) protein/tetratricopeptide (TPR) repeat protein